MKNKMNKAVAIPYIIAIILGVIVVGILAFWLINQAGKTTRTGYSAECQAKLFSFCNQWLIRGGSDKPKTFDFGRCEKPGTTTELTPLNVQPDDCKNIGITVG